MRWTPGSRSGNLEDRRGQSFGGRGLIGGGIGLGGFLLLLVLSLVTGKNFFTLVGGGGDTQTSAPAQSGPIESTPEEEKLVDFVKFVLDDAQATWAKSFAASGRNYQDAVLVIFRNITDSGCGDAQSATGPFYCPLDQKVYIDLSFYDELKRRFGAPGDFAQAYVIAHELGHHVQHELGIDSEVRRAQESNPGAANRLSVALELQADCFAGVWGHSAEQRNELEAGDIEEGLSAASAVGDDRIQRATTGRVVPDSFTHGSAEQRASWFRRGFESGDLKDCDTFAQLR